MLGRIAAPVRALFLSLTVILFSYFFQSVSASAALDKIKYTYDALGRLERVEYVESGVTYTFSYDEAGNRTAYEVAGSPAVMRLWNSRILEGGTLVMGVWITQEGLSGVSVDWEVVPGLGDNPATLNADYTNASGTIDFPDGAQYAEIHIPTIDDTVAEPFEQVYVRLKNPVGVPLDSDPSRTLKVGTIRDNDGVYFNVADVTIAEGGLASLVVERQGPLGSAVTLDVSASDLSSVVGADYEPTIYNSSNQSLLNGQLVFAANQGGSQTILVQTVDDTVYEEDEYFHVDFSWEVAGIPGWERAAVNIPNDDQVPEVHIGNSGNREGNHVEFAVWLSNPSYEPITVNYRVDSNGSNSEGYPNATIVDDYDATSAFVSGGINASSNAGGLITHVIAPGEEGAVLKVPTVSDDELEPVFEAFYATIASAAGATIDSGKSVGRGRIRDDDQGVTMTASPTSAPEGNSSGNVLSIPITLSEAGIGHPNTTVNWVVEGGTAVHGTDYTGPTSGTVEIPFGETSGSIDFTTVPNTVYSSDKTIIVRLLGWTHSSFVGGTDITATITEDDPQPVYFSVSGGSALESVTERKFTVTRTGNMSGEATVAYSITPDTAALTEDYVAHANNALSGTLTFAPNGPASQDVYITVQNDDIWEQRDDVLITLSDPSANAVISTATAEIWIGNDDGTPIINAFNNGITEADSNNYLQMTIFLQGGTIEPVTFTYKTTDGTATAGDDYVAIPETTVTIQPFNEQGERNFEHSFYVTILGDDVYEGQETFNIVVTNPVNARVLTSGVKDPATCNCSNLGTNGIGTINDNDGSPGFWIEHASASEGGTIALELIKDGTSELDHTVTITTTNVDAENSDYTLQTTSLTFGPSETSKYIYVATNDDNLFENNEVLHVNVTSPTNGARLFRGQGIATINNNDAVPGFFIKHAGISEGGVVAFELILDGNSELQHTIDYALANSSTSSNDYVDQSGTLTYVPGETSKFINVQTVEDSEYEPDEIFHVNLSNPTNGATIFRGQGIGTIVNDDAQPAYFSVAASSALENVRDRAFTITRAGNTSIAASVNYAITPDTAVYNEDYIAKSGYPLSGTLSFAANETSKQVLIEVIDDDIWEQRDDVRLTLSNPSSGAALDPNLPSNWATEIWIGNDDGTPIINIFNASKSEGNSNNTIDMIVFLRGGTMKPVTVTVKTTDGTAVAGSDYVGISSHTVNIAPREFDATVPITIIGDGTPEANETFKLEVVSATNAVTDSGTTGTANIWNDDYTYTWNVGSWGACSGGSKSRSVTCKRDQDGVTVSDGYCSGSKPATTTTSGCYTYTWSIGSWNYSGNCTASGQPGTRSVVCKRSDGATVSDGYCGSKPSTTTTRACTKVYSYGAWGSWQGACGGTQTAYRTVTCTWDPAGNSCGTTTESKTRTCNIMTYSDGPVTWGACSSSGTRTGTYVRTCTWSPSGSSCGSETKSTSGTCTPPVTYSWNTGDWSGYSACTGQTNQTRTRSVTCKRSSDGATVSDSSCSGTKPHSSENGAACSYTWNTGAWSSWTCIGIGDLEERNRAVTCRSSTGNTVSDGICGGGKPSTEEVRNNPSACGGGFGF